MSLPISDDPLYSKPPKRPTDDLFVRPIVVKTPLTKCQKCDKQIYANMMELHEKYFCGREPPEDLGWTFKRDSTKCLKCFRDVPPYRIEFHKVFQCSRKYHRCVFCSYSHAVRARSKYKPSQSLDLHLMREHGKSMLETLDVVKKDPSLLLKPGYSFSPFLVIQCPHCFSGFGKVYLFFDHMTSKHGSTCEEVDQLLNTIPSDFVRHEQGSKKVAE